MPQKQTSRSKHFSNAKREKDLLRFSTAGTVDDGKSTLIGRLLYDTQSVYDDQVLAIRGKGTTTGAQLDFALLTDGLRAEREQGITIDVAYRYFSTPRRKFIIADTPGHEQYTRNMATGASTADAAIVLVDARKGVLPQSRRHAYIATLLGVPHMVVAVNKMDLVGYDADDILVDPAEFEKLCTIRGGRVRSRIGASFHSGECVAGHECGARFGRDVRGTTGPPCWNCWSHCRRRHIAKQPHFDCRCSASSGHIRVFADSPGQIASGAIHVGDHVNGAAFRQNLPRGAHCHVRRRSAELRMHLCLSR